MARLVQAVTRLDWLGQCMLAAQCIAGNGVGLHGENERESTGADETWLHVSRGSLH